MDSLGPLEREKRVTVTFAIVYGPQETPASWDDLLLAVESSQGKAKMGDPALTSYLRVLYSIFGW